MVKHLAGTGEFYTGVGICFAPLKPGNSTQSISKTTCKRCLKMEARFAAYLAEGMIVA